MNWIDVLWPMIGAASMTLAAIHLFIWARQREQAGSLMFAITAASVAAIAFFELRLMRAATPADYETVLRWGHLPVATMVVGLIGFMRLYFHAGSRALAWAAVLTRLACLLPNFLSGANLNYARVERLDVLPIWGGDTIRVVAEAQPNPWMALAHLSNILIVLFLGSVLLDARRRASASERRRLLWVCGSLVGFVLFASEWSWAVVHGHLRAPIIFSPVFLGVVCTMGYELGTGLLRAAQLSRNLTATQSSLRDTERRMDLAVHAAGIGLWNWDVSSGQVWVSEHGLSLLDQAGRGGYDGARWRRQLHPTDRNCIEEALDAAAASGGEFRCEYRMRLDDGRTRWISAQGQLECDAAGVPLRVDGVLADISGRKHAEERFRLVVETASTAMLLVDAQGAVALANPRADALFGRAADALAGMPLEALLRTQSQQALTEQPPWPLPAIAHAADGALGVFVLRADGGEVPVEIAFHPMPIDAALYTLVSITDLSERLRMERESALQREELAHLSRVAMLSELSGSLAHELNQPLTAILTNAQAALRYMAHHPPDLHEVRDSLTNIVESDKRASEVIRRLRALLRKDTADQLPLEINEVVRDVLRIIRSDLLNRSVDAQLVLAPDLPMVRGDRVQLQQVLLNLIMNASDAMSTQDAARLEVRTALDGDRVQVAVRDNGRGIPDTEPEGIFAPFMTTKPDGLGLGLAVCNTIIGAHQGSLWAINNPEGGATVGFALPVHDPR